MTFAHLRTLLLPLTVFSTATALFLSPSANAASNDFIVESSASGGTAETATPYLELFANYANAQLKGWKPVVVSFFSERKPADAAVAAKKPGFGMLDVDLFLELQKREDITVLASVEGPIHTRGHLHVVVKDPAYKTLDDLKGKTLVSNHLGSVRFVSKVVFDGKIDAATFFTLQPSGSPMKGLKAVDRGEAAATLIDDQQLASMKSLPFGASLRTVFSSAALPPTPFVAFGKNSKPDERAAVEKMLLGMCKDAKGAEVCKALQVTNFAKADKKVYDEAVRRFGK